MTHDFERRDKIKKYVTIAFKVLFGIVAAIAFALLFGYGIMWLWNWLMPPVFGLTAIDYWQAVGILILARLLFGGWGSHYSRKGRGRSRTHCKTRGQGTLKRDFSKWKYYDNYWEEEGEKSYQEYVERKKESNNDL